MHYSEACKLYAPELSILQRRNIMKKVLLFLLLLCMVTAMIFAVSCGKTDEENAKAGILAAADEILKEAWYVCKLPAEPGNGWSYEYDDDGNVINAADDNGNALTLEYDEDGKLIKYELISDGKTSLKNEYTYNKKERTVSCKGMNYTSVTYYDESWRKTKISSYDKDGDLEMEFAYEYDNRGNMTKLSFCYDMEEYTRKGYNTFEYDKDGNKIKESTYDENGEARGYNTYEYYDDGSYIKKAYVTGGELSSITKYDKDGNKIKESHYNTVLHCEENGKRTKSLFYNADGEIEQYITYEYDENGNLIKQSRYDADDKLKESKTYEYDESGNLIKTSNLVMPGTIIRDNIFDYKKQEQTLLFF